MAKLMHEMANLIEILAKDELEGSFGWHISSGQYGKSNPRCQQDADHLDIIYRSCFVVGIRKNLVSIWTTARKANEFKIPQKLAEEINLAVAAELEVVLGVQENVQGKDGLLLRYNRQDRNCDDRVTTKVYFPNHIKHFGPQQNAQRAAATIEFMKPLIRAAKTAAEGAVRRWNLQNRR